MSEENDICRPFNIIDDDQYNFNFLAVGCWGVYCEEGKKTIIKKKEKDGKITLKSEQVIRGQRTVKEIIENLSSRYNVNTIFLAGDNIYQKSVENTNEDIPKDYNPYDIEKQIEEGFINCFLNSNLKYYFVIAGNHDVENCEILKRELEEKTWNFENLFYSTVLRKENYDVDVMCIDTNIFEYLKKGKTELCGRKDIISKQEECVKSRSNYIENSGRQTWRIMIGHIPYKALGHKSDSCIVDNSQLMKSLFDIYKPHIYISADEHNQQFLTEKIGDNNVALVVAGSGGTALDDVKICNPHNDIEVTIDGTKINIPYSQTVFGIPLFQVTKESIVIDYYIKDNGNIKSNFNAEIYYNHSIKTSIPQ
jgi:hypothetical protein